jgi:murein L,D-transpeptidase YafK
LPLNPVFRTPAVIRRVRPWIAGSGVVYALVLGVGALWSSRVAQHQGCSAGATLVQIDSSARVLTLCRNGTEDAAFRVALGRGGVAKKSEGDGRTPIGRYRIAPARASSRYHLFLEVGYPTAEQAKLGLTGSAIGVHGPHLAFFWLGPATAWPDWALGCIAVPTQGAIERIATWVSTNQVSEVLIL